MIKSKVIPAHRRNIIRLGGMCEAVVFGEKDAFFREICDVAVLVYLGEILADSSAKDIDDQAAEWE